MTVTVYTLSDEKSVRYIGVTRHPEKRAKEHCSKYDDKTYRAQWVKSLHRRGMNPVFEPIEVVPESDWQFWEQYWIQTFRGWGFRLVNTDNGGLGRLRTTDEMKAKISASLKGKKQPKQWKVIHAYGLDGKYVKSFESVWMAAKATTSNHSNICRVVGNGLSSGGFLWSYEKLDSIPTKFVNGKIPHVAPPHVRAMLMKMSIGKIVSQETREKQRAARLGKPPANKGIPTSDERKAEMRLENHRNRRVIQMSIDGIEIARWSSVKHASEQTGAPRCSIAKVCNGLNRHSKGFLWKWAGE